MRRIPRQYRHIQAAAYERRKQIVERFDDCARDIDHVKSKVMDCFNELSKERNFSPALPKRAFERAVRNRSNDRERIRPAPQRLTPIAMSSSRGRVRRYG